MPHPSHLARPAVLALLVLPLLAAALLIPNGASPTRAQTGGYLHFTQGPSGYGAIKVEDDAALTPASMTIEAWVYTLDAGCDSVVGKGYGTSYWLGLCSGVRIYWNGESIDSLNPVPLATWTHVAVTYDGTTTKIYINGLLDSESTELSGPIGVNTDAMRIGADEDWFVSPVGGAIDEVRLWSVVRTEAEIAGAMNTEISTPEAGLIAAWNMEGSADPAVGSFTSVLEADAELISGPVPTLAPTPTPEPTPTPGPAPIKGDTDCSGQIDPAEDVIPYLEFLSGLGPRPRPCPPGALSVPQGNALFEHADFSDGAGYIEVPTDPELSPTGAITLELLVYPNIYHASNVEDGGCPTLVGNGVFVVALCSGLIEVYIEGEPYTSSAPIPLNRWTHVAVTVDGTNTLRIYINGVLDSTHTDAGPLVATTNPLHIGDDPTYFEHPSAALDEVRLWDIARSEAEIFADMDVGLSGSETGLVALWALNGNAEDSAGDHDGSVVGSIDFGNGLPPLYMPDLQCSGFIDTFDALALLQYIAGMDPDVPVDCLGVGEIPE